MDHATGDRASPRTPPRPALAHVHYCPLCNQVWRRSCACRTPEAVTQLCAGCLDYLFSDARAA